MADKILSITRRRSVMSDRESFEEAAARLGYSLAMAEHETGEYHYPVTQDAWWVWQEALEYAARAQSGQGAEPVGAKEFWQKMHSFVDEYIEGYEFRGDAGDYHPSDKERGLIEDCVAGLLHDMQAEEFLNIHPQPAQHPDDAAVDRFAEAMKAKLAKKRAEGRGGWEDPQVCPSGRLQQMLL